MIQKCDAIPEDSTAAEKSHLPIAELAAIGCAPEALRQVDRFLRRLTKQNVLATVRMARLGAEIALAEGNLTRVERYLAIATATEPYNTRKCDQGFSLNSVRAFRADHGLLDPADAIDEEQRVTALFERANLQYKQAVAAGLHGQANSAVAEMEAVARQVKEEWTRQCYLRRVIGGFVELNDAPAVKRCLRGLGTGDRQRILDGKTLVRLGMKTEALARVQQDISRELKTLQETNDPNIHFPVMSIAAALELLVELGAVEDARRALRRTLKEMPTWPVIQHGWTTSSVYHSLAKAIAFIEGPVAAEKLLKQATTDAAAEPRSEFRQGAVTAILDLKASIGRLDEAIEGARKLRSPTQRRKTLGTLLAKAQRWSELQNILRQVDSPEEAAELAWLIKFELPGGRSGIG